jgi:hypothetical protein
VCTTLICLASFSCMFMTSSTIFVTNLATAFGFHPALVKVVLVYSSVLLYQANISQTIRHGQWSVMSLPVKEEDNQAIKRHVPGFNWANLPMGLAAISPWGTYTVHIDFLCTHRVYELTKFTKKSEKIYTYSFDPTQYMYKILSSNY